jgi:hypothetical protein
MVGPIRRLPGGPLPAAGCRAQAVTVRPSGPRGLRSPSLASASRPGLRRTSQPHRGNPNRPHGQERGQLAQLHGVQVLSGRPGEDGPADPARRRRVRIR